MKRYETMSKEEILDFVIKCFARDCAGDCKDCPANTSNGVWRGPCAVAYLNEEVPEPLMVRRYQNICCKQDLMEMRRTVIQRCASMDCKDCKLYTTPNCTTHLFIDYLCELEPEREKEWYLDEKYHKNYKNKA